MSLFGKIGNILGGAATGLLTGGPIGAATGALGGLLGGSGGVPRTPPIALPGGSPVSPQVMLPAPRTPSAPRVPSVGLQAQAQERCPPGQVMTPAGCLGVRSPGLGPGGVVGFGPPAQAAPAPQAQENGTIGCPSGMRPNKSNYHLRDGTFVAKGTRCVKIRRRNSLNPRALDRAISRLQGAKRASKKISRVTIRKRKC